MGGLGLPLGIGGLGGANAGGGLGLGGLHAFAAALPGSGL
jgi:hypothetical protein